MLYLNLLNRLFGKNLGVKRADLEEYATTTDAAKKQAVEEKALIDDFEQEAFEGWEGVDAKTVMKQLDKRWKSQKSLNNAKKTVKWSLIIVAGLFTTLILIINFNLKQTTSYIKSPENKTNTVIEIERSTDSIFEKQIEELAPEEYSKIADHKEIKKSTPLITSEKIDTVNIEEYSDLININVIPLEAKPIEISSYGKQLVYKSKKETYLHNLKVVDYTLYRTKPIQTERLIFSGTSADKAYEDTETEQAVWEKVDIPYIEYLDKTMALFEKGKYKKALIRFKQILNVYPKDVNALFYGGLCYYNLNLNDLALESLSNCYSLEYGNFREEANWLSYLIYKNKGNRDIAKKLLQSIIAEKGYYAAQASKEKL
ncbi:MAG: tetratricopeptide repeat protein [Lishizhenia sp.]